MWYQRALGLRDDCNCILEMNTKIRSLDRELDIYSILWKVTIKKSHSSKIETKKIR